MLREKLKEKRIILASGSPRRHQFFKELNIPFEVRLKSVEEIYPTHLRAGEISNFLAELKAAAFDGDLVADEILVTSDTVVWHKERSLAKASNDTEAVEMLKILSGDWHEVITSVCFTTHQSKRTINAVTRVKFKILTNEEIQYYVNTYKPYDKAGAYGIQEWLGHIAIEELQGSYTNVMGLPTHLVYKTLMEMAD